MVEENMSLTASRLSALGVTAAMLLAGTTAQAQQLELKRITVGTNPAGSAYYLVAGGFAKLWQETYNARTTPQPHSGSSVYIPLVDRGEMTIGLNSSLDSAMAYAGREPYREKYTNLRAMVRFWILPFAYAVRANSPYRHVEDLRGQRVIVDIRPNIPLGNANRAYLATGGLRDADVDAVPSGGVVAGLQMLQEGRVEASNVALGMPQLAQLHAAIPGGIRILPVGKVGTDELLAKEMPGMRTLTIRPTPATPFVTEEMTISAFDAFVNTSVHVSAEDTYLLVKALHENWEKLQKDYAPLRGVPANQIAPADNVLPYHEGAVRYFREVGIWTKANEDNQARF